jgi:arylsulfatase A-like enzyme
VAAYKASAAELDRGIGAVLDALDANGLAADTLVVSTTDHGLAFPWMKCNLTDHGIGVSLIMRGPGGFIGGNVCDAMISQIDIYPTLCELAGIPVPNWVQGKSFMPVINGDIDEVNDAIFAEVSYHAAYEPKRAVRTRRWKYIRRFGDKTTPVLPNIDGSPSKDVLLDHGLRERTLSGEYLYDLIYDPSESHNLAESSDASGVVTDLRRRLDDWMVATDDPLLNGPVPLPDGAVVNDPDGTSPGEKPARIPPS